MIKQKEYDFNGVTVRMLTSTSLLVEEKNNNYNITDWLQASHQCLHPQLFMASEIASHRIMLSFHSVIVLLLAHPHTPVAHMKIFPPRGGKLHTFILKSNSSGFRATCGELDAAVTYLSNAEAGRWLAGSRLDWQDATTNRIVGFLVASGRINQWESFRPVRRWELKYCCIKCNVGNLKILLYSDIDNRAL